MLGLPAPGQVPVGWGPTSDLTVALSSRTFLRSARLKHSMLAVPFVARERIG